ncbi:MAG: NAD-dependent malic enzyme, partial [Candidatus Paceibacteria bacterium]
IAAGEGLAKTVKSLNETSIVPLPFDREVAVNVAIAVAEKAVETGVARLKLTSQQIREKICERLVCCV